MPEKALGFTERSAKRIADVVRAVERAGVSNVGPRRGKFDSAPAETHAWKVTIVYDDDASAYKIRVAPGYRYATNQTQTRVPTAGSDPDYTVLSIGASVYVVYTLATTTAAGSWGSVSSGSAPSPSATTRVIVIADIDTGTTPPRVTMQHVRGDIEVFDPVAAYSIDADYKYLGTKADHTFGADYVRAHG